LEEDVGQRHGFTTTFADACGEVPLTEDVRSVLYRNARELLTNVIKHAAANTVSVRMETAGNELRITVEDDGVGFDPEAPAPTSDREGGFGLFSIRERMADLGGSLQIVSAPGKGCRATLIAPLDA
jgi:signal transduction histidine kinase